MAGDISSRLVCNSELGDGRKGCAWRTGEVKGMLASGLGLLLGPRARSLQCKTPAGPAGTERSFKKCSHWDMIGSVLVAQQSSSF